MLSVMKNALVTTASKDDGSIRKRELDWYSKNCWIIATQSSVIAGFTFSQLSSPPDAATSNSWSHLVHITLTALGFVSSLGVLLRATLSGVHAQGIALRGREGFSDMAAAIKNLGTQQDYMLRQFLVSVVCFILSSIALVFKSRSQVGDRSVKVEAALLFVSIALAAVICRYIRLFYHRTAAVGGVAAIEGVYSNVRDLDALATEDM